MFRSAALLVIASTMFVGSASALNAAQIRQCNAMAATFEAKQGDIAQLQATRDALAADTEVLGQAWELSEEQRAFSAGHAAQADADLAAWEARKTETLRAEMALQGAVRMLNADFAQYNTRCAQ